MQPDEQLYELAARELATSPRRGLLIKCMTKANGDENKGKARYIEIRVKELKAEITEDSKRQRAIERQDESTAEPTQVAQIISAFIFSLIAFCILASLILVFV